MTVQEYKDGLKSLQKKYEMDKFALAKIFVRANNPYNVGDIVRDHIGSIKIEAIGFFGHDNANNLPCAVFTGTELTKDLKPARRQTGRFVYQLNVIEKIS